MRLTKQTNYALRILLYCAINENNLSTIPAIAEAYGISKLFLFKIINILSKHGLLTTVRGRNGGIKLAKPADQITIAEIITVTEENFYLADCFMEHNRNCPLLKGCGLNKALHDALTAFMHVLTKATLAEVTKQEYNMAERLGLYHATPAFA